MASDLSAAHKSFVRVFTLCGPQFIYRDIERHHLQRDYERARRAGFFQSSGIETTVKADDWLNTEAGHAALIAKDASNV